MGFARIEYLKKFILFTTISLILFAGSVIFVIQKSEERNRQWEDLEALLYSTIVSFEDYRFYSLDKDLEDFKDSRWLDLRKNFAVSLENLLEKSIGNVISTDAYKTLNEIKEVELSLDNLLTLNKVFEEKIRTLYLKTLQNRSKNNDKVINTLVLLFIIMFLFTGFTHSKIRNKENHSQDRSIMAMEAAIDALAYQVELKDDYTGKHVERAAKYVEAITRELSKNRLFKKYLTESYISALVRSAKLHDIGKIAIPDSILLKPGKLTTEEFEIIKTHTTHGADTIRMATIKLPFNSYLNLATRLIESHHENWDGTGYPKGLKGDHIPLSGRIMSVADTYDAMRSTRVYKEKIDHDECVSYIKSQSGIKFDKRVVRAFINIEKYLEELSYKV